MEPHHRRPLFLLSALLLASLSPAIRAHAQASPTSDVDGPVQPKADISRAHPLDNDAIIRMTKAGLSDDVIIQSIRSMKIAFDTSPDALITLKQAGVSDPVLAAMQTGGTGVTLLRRAGPPRIPLSAPSARVSPSPLALGIDEIGVYFEDKSGAWAELPTERVVFQSGGFLKHVLTDGLVAQDSNGRVSGAGSSLKLTPGTKLAIYAPFGTDAAEYVFLQFREHASAREFRVLTGSLFHTKSGADRDAINFTATKLGPQIYTFTVPDDIVEGEYGVLPPASSNMQGIAGSGKIFTFAVAPRQLQKVPHTAH